MKTLNTQGYLMQHDVELVTVNVYALDGTLTYCTATVPSEITSDDELSITITASSGYQLTASALTSISGVSSGNYSWTLNSTGEGNNGTLTLKNPTENVSFTVVGEEVSTNYTLTFNDTLGCTVNGSSVTSPTTIQSGDTIRFYGIIKRGYSFTINGTSYTSGSTISLSDTDVVANLTVGSGAQTEFEFTVNFV